MTRPASAAEMLTSLSCPKLIVSGSRAEQPNPASAKAGTLSTGARGGSAEIAAKAPASTNGSRW